MITEPDTTQQSFAHSDSSISEIYDNILNYARRLHAEKPDWSHFFRETLGVRGMARQLLRTSEAVYDFEQSDAYLEIMKLLTSLRTQDPTARVEAGPEPTKVITVRLPKSLHETLRDEAFHRRTSMNKLCISKLIQCIDDELVPEEI